jgi:hypothetical protein
MKTVWSWFYIFMVWNILCFNNHERIYWYCCLTQSSVFFILAPLENWNKPESEVPRCYQLHSLTGPLGNLACSPCGKTEMELVLSCVHLPCLSLLPLVCCQVFNPISIQACSFQMNNVIPLKCDSSNNKLKHSV